VQTAYRLTRSDARSVVDVRTAVVVTMDRTAPVLSLCISFLFFLVLGSITEVLMVFYVVILAHNWCRHVSELCMQNAVLTTLEANVNVCCF